MPLPQFKNVRRVVIGMIHLEPLPGSPRYGGSMEAITGAALRDAEALVEGGVHGLMMENFGDIPFFPGRVGAETVSAMTAVACAVRGACPQTPLGINVLRNDGLSALSIAAAAGGSFIRVNVLCGARVADQGLLQGIAHDLARLRRSLGADAVRVFADVDVKHSSPLSPRDLKDEVDDTLHRGLADALIVSGAGTGKATDLTKLAAVKQAAGAAERSTPGATHGVTHASTHGASRAAAPVYVGSGVTAQTASELGRHCDGFIVGTAVKRDGKVDRPVDVARVSELVKAAAAGA